MTCDGRTETELEMLPSELDAPVIYALTTSGTGGFAVRNGFALENVKIVLLADPVKYGMREGDVADAFKITFTTSSGRVKT